jgi:hypothetical protein
MRQASGSSRHLIACCCGSLIAIMRCLSALSASTRTRILVASSKTDRPGQPSTELPRSDFLVRRYWLANNSVILAGIAKNLNLSLGSQTTLMGAWLLDCGRVPGASRSGPTARGRGLGRPGRAADRSGCAWSRFTVPGRTRFSRPGGRHLIVSRFEVLHLEGTGTPKADHPGVVNDAGPDRPGSGRVDRPCRPSGRREGAAGRGSGREDGRRSARDQDANENRCVRLFPLGPEPGRHRPERLAQPTRPHFASARWHPRGIFADRTPEDRR